MEIFYNPEHTPLRGRPNIFMRAGWNRWDKEGALAHVAYALVGHGSVRVTCDMHSKSHTKDGQGTQTATATLQTTTRNTAPHGPRRWNHGAPGGRQQHTSMQAIEMEPCLAGGIGFYRAELNVPQDAWGMDLVFIDNPNVSGCKKFGWGMWVKVRGHEGRAHGSDYFGGSAHLRTPQTPSTSVLVQPNQATGFYDNNGGLDYHLFVRQPEPAGAAGLSPSGQAFPRTRAPLKVSYGAGFPAFRLCCTHRANDQ